MLEESPNTGAKRVTPKKRSPIIPILITLGCAVLLTGGFVVGFAATCGPNFRANTANTVFLWLSIAGLAVIGLCLLCIVIWGVVQVVRKIGGS